MRAEVGAGGGKHRGRRVRERASGGSESLWWTGVAVFFGLLSLGPFVHIAGINTYRVTAGATFNLTTWTGTGGAAYVLSVAAGQVKSSTGSIY